MPETNAKLSVWQWTAVTHKANTFLSKNKLPKCGVTLQIQLEKEMPNDLVKKRHGEPAETELDMRFIVLMDIFLLNSH